MILIDSYMEQKLFDQCQAAYISKELKISRNQLTRILNELFDEKKLIKVKTNPITYLDREALERKYKKKLTTDEYKSIDALENELTNQEQLMNFEKLIGHNESMYQIVEKIKATVSYPPIGLPMLFYGPTGTGKSFMAKLTYEYCVDTNLIESDKSFVQVNCSEYANNPELLTANLFGYKKGAFTGADNDNMGLLHYADGGVLFLDEVHCLSAECQEKLFLYMDQGIYHLVGDNSKWYKSRCRIIFATTELPEKALLKTFLRRIPVILTVPSLAQRGQNEKLQLMYSLLKKEEKRIGKKILISSNVYELLLNHTFVGNIGELTNAIQASCVSALYNSNSDTLEIHAYDLPQDIKNNFDLSNIVMKKHKLVSLDKLLPVSEQGIILEFYKELVSLDRNQKFALRAQSTIEDYFEKLIFNNHKVDNLAYIINYLEKIISNMTEHYGFKMSHNELIAIAKYISEFSKNTYITNNWINENYDEVNNFKKYLSSDFHHEFEIGQEIYQHLKNNMNQDIDDFVGFIICICLIKYFAHSGDEMTVAMIIAHGYSTASSIAEAANRMLDTYIFDAIDMPLDVDVKTITRKINDYLAHVGNISNLYLLVDMGSLEEIYQGLDINNVNIALINNVNTKCALEIGQGIKLKKPVKEVINSVLRDNLYRTHVQLKKKKEKVILCSCASGLGTATKIKDILLQSLPENVKLKIITYDYPALVKKDVYNQLANEYEIVCCIGTLDPNIESMKYIGIQDLIINEGQNAVEVYFGKYMSKEQIALFEKNILHNFTLSNVMNNITILNPDKLLEHVARALDQLQSNLHKRFKNRTSFGLYVHVCCLVERLVTRQAITNFTDEHFKEKHQDFIEQVLISMQEVQRFYNVEIPEEEIEYIYNYIISD